MKHIYITALHLHHGGVEKVISSLANMFIEMGHDVTILCTYQLGEPVYPIDNKVRIKYLTDLKPNREEFKAAIRSKNPIKIVKNGFYAIKVLYQKKQSLIKEFKTIQDGVIISTRNEHSVLLSKYGNTHVNKIAQLHHDHRFDEKLIHDFQHGYTNIDDFLLLTPRLKDEVEGYMRSTNHHTKCHCVPNFLDKDTYARNLPKINQIVTVGRLHPDKGYDRLLNVWSEFIKLNPNYTLKIIGEGESRKDFEVLVKELNIQNSVVFTGFLAHNNTLDEMSQSLVYVMTSISEGFPMVLLESMSQGTPTIAFDVRVGPEAIISDGIDGYLVADNDITQFAHKLDELLENPELLKSMSLNALNKADIYSQDKVSELWKDLLA
ncbi:glycosyltransferase family 4 protein [Erysipelothrix sp. HDW6A]|uniref:glycosyltransferase n=1 Tax=Erysipelothrix sp. HDW6A TaxID=2714928 RepID=UPI00140BEF3A|nr:glycosyltransferase [Erysipelothrix sp. HDW6A]QIK57516.1 glycosyltransferase family 4 protein [Erysipelothrix sp. HDW6A]